MAPPESTDEPSQSQQAGEASSSSSTAPNPDVQSAYNDLRRLIPMLASELDHLRAALREHNLWLQRYGHSAASAPTDSHDLFTALPAATAEGVSASTTRAAASDSTPTTTTTTRTTTITTEAPSLPIQNTTDSIPPREPPPSDLPGYSEAPALPDYSASDVPPYTGGPQSTELIGGSSTSTAEEVAQRRDELTNWLAEGEDTLREYSGRFAQLGAELGVFPPEDVLGTWNEAHADNALPDYEAVETREELMVGGVGEVPPPYVRGKALEEAVR